MKWNLYPVRSAYCVVLACSVALRANAVVFTNDTLLGVHNSAFDGQAIVVSNCTLTIDGAHTFDSLKILRGGVLTHSFSTNGLLPNLISVTGESHGLSSTNPPTLSQADVITNTVLVTDAVGSVTYTQGVDYVLIPTGNLTEVALAAGSSIADNTTVLVSYQAVGAPVASGLALTVTNDVEVEVGGMIDVMGKGYGGGYGPGAGASLSTISPYAFAAGGGGSYGGYGGAGSTTAGGGACYGNFDAAADKGSGGGVGNGAGGNGGGALNLLAGGTIRIDGQVRANGASGLSPHSGGGAGGGVWLSSPVFTGTGLITANGGAGEPFDGGGGGGGRIAIFCATNAFTGNLVAGGGHGAMAGGAGTVYLRPQTGLVAQLSLDNQAARGTNTPLFNPATVTAARLDIVVRGGAIAEAPVVGAATFKPQFHNLIIESNSGWAVLSTQLLSMTVTGDAEIQPGATINGVGRGYLLGTGSGRGLSPALSSLGLVGSGGGYGGCGGVAVLTNILGGNGYGSAAGPIDFGSGGGGISNAGTTASAGGGALRLIVNGTLTMNGSINLGGSSGVVPGGGGGAGGSVWVTAGNLMGQGSITANGGNGDLPYGGGGGGGRIALICGTNSFGGQLTAFGGRGFAYGGAGTVYTKITTNQFAQLTVDNGGILATNTVLNNQIGTVDLTLRRGARIDPVSLYSVGSIRDFTVGSNCWLIPGTSATLISLNFGGNVTIERGGGISLNGSGSVPGKGSGAGQNATVGSTGTMGGGGGNGGNGGRAANGAAGGTAYGSAWEPSQPGSGGGYGSGNFPTDGSSSGGGALRIGVAGLLVVDGQITADGTRGVNLSSGGGSGGSIWLSVYGLAGSGLISANGGAGDLPNGGGGGGGRIAVVYSSVRLTNRFNGTLTAYGGQGAVAGGAGTVFGSVSGYTLLLDNGGLAGGSTPLAWQTGTSLTVRGGAVGSLAGSAQSYVSLNNLTISSNSWLLLTNTIGSLQLYSLTVASNATVESGGGIRVDGAGYQKGQGPGAGATTQTTGGTAGGGGGYAGYGGAAANGALGGNAYGSVPRPTEPGSGGGGGQSVTIGAGGSGGGTLHLTVNRQLQLDGWLSANGMAASGANCGGGSGGSLWLTVGTLVGQGLVSVNGGDGDPPNGGGGGGGRIAVYYATNQFAGTLVARGGAGAKYGGAGTIFLQGTTRSATYSQFIINNGGNQGTNTLLSVPDQGVIYDLQILGGAIASPPSQLAISSSGFMPNLRNLLIGSNAWLTLLGTGTGVSYSNATLTASGDITLQAGGGINLNGKGYTSGRGVGGYGRSGTYFTGGGGGYGGFGGGGLGGSAGGIAYGSLVQPTDFGSGGAGYGGSAGITVYSSPGGGALHVQAPFGALVLDGRISADGASAIYPDSGGGSGGSVWLTVGRLAGAGSITADGGAGDYPQGGGGGGGRVAITCFTNDFAGSVSARGGLGAVSGGAGTVYWQPNGNKYPGQLFIDNGGFIGSNTPIAGVSNLTLNVSGGAIAYPTLSPLLLNGLRVDTGGQVTHLGSQSNLDLMVDGDATVGAGAGIVVSGKGYAGTNAGPGAGVMAPNGSGSGAGYGGKGGASLSGAAGGPSYGSAAEPIYRGSRGGVYPVLSGFCEGGGAIRLKVTGTLEVDGVLSADGNGALFESGGGGAGGSIWVTARQLKGNGAITANGGDGNPVEGGGGGGGRIALYAGTNHFIGTAMAAGGTGAANGEDGTVLLTNLPPLRIVAQQPGDLVFAEVSSVDLTFSSPLKFASPVLAEVSLDTPLGMLSSSNVQVFALSKTQLRVSFPAQAAFGYYELEALTQNADIYGATMAGPYVGSFIIWPPEISGHVYDTNNLPVPYVTLRLGSGLLPVMTDHDGAYSVEVPPSWAGTITPSKGSVLFFPASRTYTAVSENLTNQDFVMATSGALNLTGQRVGADLAFNWWGLRGVTYQLLYSTNLADWIPYGGPIIGTNGPMSSTLPIGSEPAVYFRYRSGE